MMIVIVAYLIVAYFLGNPVHMGKAG